MDNTGNFSAINLTQELLRQSSDGEFICRYCRNWEEGCKCKKNIFIGFVEANMEGCFGYEQERRKRNG